VRRLFVLVTFAFLSFSAAAQDTIAIRVEAASKLTPLKPLWNYFGYDEPNYTYGENGVRLIGELASSNAAPVFFRTHNLLTTGDGTPSFKWGSTNAYTEDSTGNPIYDWTIVDRIIGTYVQSGARPFVEIGFMPRALSTKPDPYSPIWKPGDKFDHYYLGWTYPPTSYNKWAELVYQWVKHCIRKYGAQEVAAWQWEVWNEPDIGYWHGTPEEYDKLFDFTIDAVKRALPAARVGGPASTGPGNPKAAAFLRQFLDHCASGKNYATGALGTQLDFISFHAKGSPQVEQGKVQMGLAHELNDVERGFEIVSSYPSFQHLPIVLSEADPEGCAACSARVYPQNAYRNGALYPAYTAAAIKAALQSASRFGVNLEGFLTWAFEFEGQPYFDGLRTLATNGLDKPILNFFRMAGLLQGDRVKVESTGAPKVDALAAESAHNLSILVWNYQNLDVPGPADPVQLTIERLPAGANRVAIKHYRIDQTHSNAFTAWQRLGSPQDPSPEQIQLLEHAGQLELLESPRFAAAHNGTLRLEFVLPLQGLSLFELSW
jgi:xylan 1,4-beta-xylosidase